MTDKEIQARIRLNELNEQIADTASKIIKDVMNLVLIYPNDADLGREIRKAFKVENNDKN